MLTPDDIAQITKALGALDLTIREATLALREHTEAMKAAPAPRPASPDYEARRPPGTPAPAQKFEGDWRAFAIPFGRQQGQKLGDIPGGSLRWWIENYQPKDYNGNPPRQSDLAFRAALDAAKAAPAGESRPAASKRQNDLPLEKQNNLVNPDGTPAGDEHVPF